MLKKCDREHWQWELYLIFYFILKMDEEERAWQRLLNPHIPDKAAFSSEGSSYLSLP